MNIDEIQTYSHADLTTFTLLEDAGNWRVVQSSAFKKGMKKHRNNKVVVAAFKEIMNFIKSHDGVPPVRSYPPHLNVHHIKRHATHAGSMWAHLQGQKIGLMFYVDPNEVKLIHIGSHQQVNL
ncbi:hypothetical protein KAT92_05815 [Candidatus Babeliales bacterium]|nr:hypothetical protein [Candidatus Babeliales bacterium]